jgi:three-Cys-motif partner protein
MAKRSDLNPAYWDGYSPFNQVKHDLIRCYLNGWYPKLGFWAGRVLYADTHAGRGKYETGDPGSPVVALQTFLDHRSRPALLAKSEFNFLFIERDPENLASLRAELSRFELPKRVKVETSESDAFDKLSAILADLKSRGQRMAPAFLFVDPYGFKIPIRLLADLIKAGRVELFINVMWRELDMLICQRPAAGTAAAQTLDDLFGGDSWREGVTAADSDARLNQAIPLIAHATGAKWWTSAVRMVSGGQATRYLLLHLTTSDDGRDLMKECSWRIFPDGEFVARKSDHPDQQFLFEREPNLEPLERWVLARLAERPYRWQELHEAVRPEWWLATHVNIVVKKLKADGAIVPDPIPGLSPARAFTIKANPLLLLAARRSQVGHRPSE